MLQEAKERIAPFVHKTPVIPSGYFNRLSGAELFFKCENFQKIGAFKMRGATNAILALDEVQRRKGVATHSSGNHAQAVALAARSAGTSAHIIMPQNAPRVKVDAVREYGAEIYFCEPTLQARENKLEEIVKTTGAIFIPPYDHPDIIAGQATAAMELLEEIQHLDVLVAPVGGGGLLAGTALAAHFFGPARISVIAAEPSGAADAFRSFLNKKLEPSLQPDTIADGLLTSVGKLNFSVITELVEKILLVDDKEIASTMKDIMERMKIIVEPSAAVSLAAVLKQKSIFRGKKVGIILSGGNIDLLRIPQIMNLLD